MTDITVEQALAWLHGNNPLSVNSVSDALQTISDEIDRLRTEIERLTGLLNAKVPQAEWQTLVQDNVRLTGELAEAKLSQEDMRLINREMEDRLILRMSDLNNANARADAAERDAERLDWRGLGNEVLVVFPRSVRGVGSVAQVDEGAGEHEHATVKLGVKPRHRESGRPAGAAAQRGAGIRVRAESDVTFLGDAG